MVLKGEVVDLDRLVENKTNLLKEYITVSELQSILKISRTQAYALVALPNFPKIRIGKSIRIPQIELDKYLKHNLYRNIQLK